MTQPKFIWTINNSKPDGIVIKGGVVHVDLRDGIYITHDYAKEDKIEICINRETYCIADDSELEEILKMHLENKDASMIIYDYCKNNLHHEKDK